MDRIRLSKISSTEGVLFLQGVYKSDCKQMEDIFQDRLIPDDAVKVKIYDKIPSIFTDTKSWLKQTNILCWFCDRSFKEQPWFEPQSIEPQSIGSVGKMLTCNEVMSSIANHKVKIIPKGIFCTCNCVRAYIDLHTKDISSKHNKVSMLKYVYELFMNKTIPDIQPSPDHTDMVQYGGYLSTDEYQKKIDQLDNAYCHELDDNNFSNICDVYLDTMTK
jgi:hypothetical protein